MNRKELKDAHEKLVRLERLESALKQMHCRTFGVSVRDYSHNARPFDLPEPEGGVACMVKTALIAAYEAEVANLLSTLTTAGVAAEVAAQ